MIERYQLIQNLVWSGWYTWEAAQEFASNADLSVFGPHFPIGPDGQGCVKKPPKYGHGAIPHLFDDADGIPPKLSNYIATQERIARQERGDSDRSDAILASAFNERGVAKICLDLLSEIEARQKPRKGIKGLPPDGGAYAKSWCYALQVYCANRGERATPELLRLTFRTLGCSELSPHPEMRCDVGILEKSRNRSQFLDAIEADAEHWARYGRQCPDEALAALVDVSGKTIRGHWRKEPEYLHRLRFAISNWLSELEYAGEPTGRDLIDFKALAQRDAAAQRDEAQSYRRGAKKSGGEE